MTLKIRMLLLIIVTLSISGFVLVPAGKVAPADHQPEIANLVANYLTYYHYERYTINDKISNRLLKQYLESLDYNKMFFLQSDIDQFEKFAPELDDDLRENPARLDKPFKIFNVYRQRVEERVKAILTLLDKDFDFTKDEYFAYDRSDSPWPKTREELDELWRLRLKEDLVRFKLRDKPDEESLDLLRKRYERLQKSILEYEPADILEQYLTSLAESFDPHSSYLKPETKENFDIQMGHSLEGIGATLRQEGEYTVVVDLVKGGPADRSNQVHPKDKIVAVAQGDGEPEDVVDLRLDKVVKKIRGPKGTKVRLTIIPGDSADYSSTKEVTLIRDRVALTSLDAQSKIKEIKGPDGKTHRLGVIEIPSFYLDSAARFRGERNYKSTTNDVRNILKNLEQEEVDGIVIDLRQNGGGSLDEAIQLTGLFIESGPVVQIRDYRGNVRVENDPDPTEVYGGPLLVLTSVFSASASEIFASAIQDYERGIVVGSDATHGKGTVQNVVPLDRALSNRVKQAFEDEVAGALKLTTHKFYRISGGSTQFKGVEPDIDLPSPYDGLKVREEALDYALTWDEIHSVDFKPYGNVRQTLPFLKSNSAKRVAANPEFRYVREDLEYREREQKDKRLSLNLEKRREEKAKLDAIEKEREKERELRTPVAKTESKTKEGEESEEESEEQHIPDFTLDEAILILTDYIALQSDWVAEVDASKKKSL